MIDFNDIINTFLNYRNSSSAIKLLYFNNWYFYIQTIGGILFSLSFLPFVMHAPQNAVKKFKFKYPGENILITTKNSICLAVFALFLWGLGIGKYILPFICFDSFDVAKNFIGPDWWFGLYIYPVLTYFVLFRFNIVYIFSDKRIELISAYSIYNKITKKNSISLKEIQSLQFCDSLFGGYLKILYKNGGVFDGIAYFVNLQRVANIVNIQLNRSYKNE